MTNDVVTPLIKEDIHRSLNDKIKDAVDRSSRRWLIGICTMLLLINIVTIVKSYEMNQKAEAIQQYLYVVMAQIEDDKMQIGKLMDQMQGFREEQIRRTAYFKNLPPPEYMAKPLK